MAFEHARRAAVQRPQPHGVVPRRRRDALAVGRHRERHDGRGMAGELLDRVGRPGCQIAILPSSPPVTSRPSGRIATAFTALSWKRITCSATLRSSDQRIAEVSKLPDSAVLPSAEIASARTGPPWPRNCACALPSASGANSNAAQIRLIIGGLHAERGDAFARVASSRKAARNACTAGRSRRLSTTRKS